jgi:hypothetical protein
METIKCRGCGKEIPEQDALYRGGLAKDNPGLIGRDWRLFGKCGDCDYADYSNTYGGM